MGFFGSDCVYDFFFFNVGVIFMLGGEDERSRSKRKKFGDVDVVFDLEVIVGVDGISKDDLRRKFEEGRREEERIGGRGGWSYDEDLSEMIV